MRSDQAKLAALEAELPSPNAKKYMRYEDMPPPSPEQEAEFDREFQNILEALFDDDEEETASSNPQQGPKAGQSVQDWMIGMGLTLPDSPEWKTPLYLDKFVRI